MEKNILNSRIFKDFALSSDLKKTDHGDYSKTIYMIHGNSEKTPLVRMHQLIDKVIIRNKDDALAFVSIRTSPILCDAHSTLCFGEFCLEVIPRENAKYNFTFGTIEQFESYKLKSALFPPKKSVSSNFQNYPNIEKRDVFVIRRLIMSNYGYLYEIEEHLSERGKLLMEKRTLLNTLSSVGRGVYILESH